MKQQNNPDFFGKMSWKLLVIHRNGRSQISFNYPNYGEPKKEI